MDPSTIAVIAVVVIVFILFVSSYVKAPTDKVYIITGGGKRPKYLIGKAGFRIPFIQRKDVLDLQMLSVDVNTTQTIPTLDYININVDAVAVVKIGASPELLSRASENFLNKNTRYINEMVVNVLEGNLREIIGSMKLTDIMNDRRTFAEKVQENAAGDMENMGLQIVTFNIQNINDAGLGVIENLGIANTVAIQKSAEISRAQATKEITVAQAQANQAANEAEVASQTAIAERNTALALRQADLKAQADTETAKAEAAGQIEAQKQQKTINTEKVNAQIAQAERDAELRQKQVAIKERELDANVRKQADADKYAAQQKAEAQRIQRENEAEAAKYEQERQAEAVKAKADAARYSAEQEAAGVQARGLADAAAIQAKGEADAAVIKAKGMAEAEAMERKADAYEKYNGAAVAQMMIQILPEMAKAIAEPISSIDSINIYDSGAGTGTQDAGASRVSGITPAVLKQTFDVVKSTTGVDLADIMRANTYDARTNHNVSLSAAPGVAVSLDGQATADASPDAPAEVNAADGAAPAADKTPAVKTGRDAEKDKGAKAA